MITEGHAAGGPRPAGAARLQSPIVGAWALPVVAACCARPGTAIGLCPATAEPALLTEAAASFRIAALGLTDWLSLLWLTGALLVLSLFLRAAREGLALTRDTGPAGEDLAALFHECRQLAGGSTSVRLQVSLRVEVPAVCGLFNPVLLWPAGLEAQLEREQVRHVLLHELMHLRRFDIPAACFCAPGAGLAVVQSRGVDRLLAPAQGPRVGL